MSKNRKALKNIKKRQEKSFRRKRIQEYKNNIIKFDNNLLYSKAEDVDIANDDLSFIDKMINSLNAHEDGVGLAANQIGVLKKVIVIDALKTLEPQVFINPEIISQSEETDTYQEGCLSYPEFFINVVRPVSVKIKYYDRNNKEHVANFTNFEARIIYHEMDHLNGICLTGDYWKRQMKLTYSET